MRKILVAGGAGYIGSHTAVSLIENGYEVIIADNLSNSNIDVLEGIKEITGVKPEFVKADLQNTLDVEKLFENNKIDAIIHFAASKAVAESVEKPLLYYGNNINTTLNLLQAMQKYHVQHIVFSSSCTVYGQPDELPVTEHSPRKEAESPYGNTKSICEDILRDTCSAHPEIQSIALRYFNPIGAHESACIGELPLGVPANLVPYITQTAIGERECLQVFGTDYNTPDGSCIRDFIHVVDLANAHVVALKRLITKKNLENYEVFNIGTGNGVSVLELITSFEKTTQKKLPYKMVERRKGDIEKIYADATFANEELGWKAEKTLEEALLSAWKWEVYCRTGKHI